MHFENSWGNKVRSNSYSKLEFPNTYYLAYRDLPDIIAHPLTVNIRSILDTNHELYYYDWASFSAKDFPQTKKREVWIS